LPGVVDGRAAQRLTDANHVFAIRGEGQ
jgi:hypothetical protein